MGLCVETLFSNKCSDGKRTDPLGAGVLEGNLDFVQIYWMGYGGRQRYKETRRS